MKKYRTSLTSTWTVMEHCHFVEAENEREVQELAEDEVDLEGRDEFWCECVECEDIVQVCYECHQDLESDEEKEWGVCSGCRKQLAEQNDEPTREVTST